MESHRLYKPPHDPKPEAVTAIAVMTLVSGIINIHFG